MNKITDETLSAAMRRLTVLKKFSQLTPEGLAFFSEMLAAKCENDVQVNAVVERILYEFDECPGPKSLREALARIWRELYGPKNRDGTDPYSAYQPDWQRNHSGGGGVGSVAKPSR
jgi:hypothetical protein